MCNSTIRFSKYVVMFILLSKIVAYFAVKLYSIIYCLFCNIKMYKFSKLPLNEFIKNNFENKIGTW